MPDPIEFKDEWLAIATKLHGTMLDKAIPKLGKDLTPREQYTKLSRKLRNWKQIKAITPQLSVEDVDGLAASVILTREIASQHMKDYGKVVRTELHDAARNDAETILDEMGVLPDLLGGLGDPGLVDQHGRLILDAAGKPRRPRVEMGKRLAQAVDNARDDNWYGRLKKGIKFGPKKIIRAVLGYLLVVGLFLLYTDLRFPDVLWWIFAILLLISAIWGLIGMMRGLKLLHTLYAFAVIFVAGCLLLVGVSIKAKDASIAQSDATTAGVRSCAQQAAAAAQANAANPGQPQQGAPGCDFLGREPLSVAYQVIQLLTANCSKDSTLQGCQYIYFQPNPSPGQPKVVDNKTGGEGNMWFRWCHDNSIQIQIDLTAQPAECN